MSLKNSKVSLGVLLAALILSSTTWSQTQRRNQKGVNGTTAATKNTILVNFKAPKKMVAPTMWGIFFEDINFAADGGIYAELVKNRSFEFPEPMTGWQQLKSDQTTSSPDGSNKHPETHKSDYKGKLLITSRGNDEVQTEKWGNNYRYARIDVDGLFGLQNEGFRGIGVHQGATYNFSALFHNESNVAVELRLVDSTNRIVAASGWVTLPKNTDWLSFKLAIKATATAAKAHLEIRFKGKGHLDADMLSLFPDKTWKNRPGGMRADLVQKLADLKPGFIRFPGGCIVEGRTLVNRYQWKNTVGPVGQRKLIMNRWNVEFKAPRNAPDYYQSYGLGFYEYFQLAEDIGAAPLPILNCGMACQYNSGELAADLDPYIQDALDLIEFANGDQNTRWGKLRADMGHPKPFHLQYLGIGNEQWDTQYFERYEAFSKVLKQQHPEIQLVSGSGPSADGHLFDQAWDTLRRLKPALIDEHYYKPPQWFLANAGRYDHYDPSGPKVFAGEYAAHGRTTDQPESGNSWYSALTEAAFMTGLERNADIVKMASYAPLLAHIDAWQWRPDLIWFNNLHSMVTPNYYVQQLFSKAKGQKVIETTCNAEAVKGQDSIYASTTLDSVQHLLNIKVINVSSNAKIFTIKVVGAKLSDKAKSLWELLTANHLYAYNSLDNQQVIHPIFTDFDADLSKTKQGKQQEPRPSIQKGGQEIKLTLPAYSVNLYQVAIKE